MALLASCGARHERDASAAVREDDGALHLVRIAPSDKVAYGRLYYLVRHDVELAQLNVFIVNALGPDVFVETSSLRIASKSVKNPRTGAFSRGGGGGRFTLKGPRDYLRLAYDQHADGSICGWQLTPCGSIPSHDLQPDDLISFTIRIRAFLDGADRTLHIACDELAASTLGVQSTGASR